MHARTGGRDASRVPHDLGLVVRTAPGDHDGGRVSIRSVALIKLLTYLLTYLPTDLLTD